MRSVFFFASMTQFAERLQSACLQVLVVLSKAGSGLLTGLPKSTVLRFAERAADSMTILDRGGD